MLGRVELSADLAIELYENLIEARRLYLHPALSEAIKKVGVIRIDEELHRFVPDEALNHLAQLGLRGELVFPIPSIRAYPKTCDTIKAKNNEVKKKNDTYTTMGSQR